MKQKILNFYEAMRDYFFTFIIYTILCIAVFVLGGYITRGPHIFKLIGVLLMVGAVYVFTYFPTYITVTKIKK